MREAEASAGLALDGARPVPSVVVEGSGQSARKAARERSQWSRPKCYRIIELELEAIGLRGLTRGELHRLTGIPMNTINPVVVEMRAFTDGRRVVTEGKRGTESRVVLARLQR